MAVVTRGMRVVEATMLEWPQIEALREAYFAANGLPVQRRGDEARWFVALDGEVVRGCYAVADFPDYGQRWALDFYVADGPSRKRAVYLMARRLYDEAAADGLAVLFHALPTNGDWLYLAARRGLQVQGVLLGGVARFRARIGPKEGR
jgi:hypothetical protein